MFYIICSILFAEFIYVNSFFVNNGITHIKNILNMQKNDQYDLFKPWEETSKYMKQKARNWFIERAEKKGIRWREYLEPFKTAKVATELFLLKDMIENKTIIYPNYFLKPFHGYDTGNMNWDAAKEGEGATISMSVNYWPNSSPEESELWLRTNYTNTMKEYIYKDPEYILDIGSSIGVGTEFIKKAFNTSVVQGLDLSPYFVALSTFRSSIKNTNITFIHANAEEIPIPSNTLDLVTVQYLFHEVPREPTQKIIDEIYRVLKPNGTISIIDLDGQKLSSGLSVNVFRRWAFEVTEPHIFEYYTTNMTKLIENSGFLNIESNFNDPVNRVWLGKK